MDPDIQFLPSLNMEELQSKHEIQRERMKRKHSDDLEDLVEKQRKTLKILKQGQATEVAKMRLDLANRSAADEGSSPWGG